MQDIHNAEREQENQLIETPVPENVNEPAPAEPEVSEEAEEQLPPPERNYRLIVFGGSFDPIHNGHLQLAKKVLELGYGDEVMFVPALYPPHLIPKSLTSPEHRLEMLRRAIGDNPRFSYTDMELQRTNCKSYSIDTMELIQKIYPGYELYFLMGMDSLRELRSWHRASEFVHKYNFLIYPRPGVMPVPYSQLFEAFGARNARKLLDSILQDENLPIWDISSRELREACRSGEDLSEEIPAPAWQYIVEKKLYL